MIAKIEDLKIWLEPEPPDTMEKLIGYKQNLYGISKNHLS